MSDSPLNPVDVEKAIAEIRNRIANGVRIVTEAEKEAKRLRRDFDLAFAHAYKAAEGSIPDRKYQAQIDTIELREAAEDAEIAFNYAERTAWALKDELSALQSIGASVRAMYETAGRS
jgi:hypothetical protein